MALTDEDLEKIEAIVKSRDCSCGLSTEAQGEMGHLFGRMKDLGKGNLNVGIEKFSKAVTLVANIRSLGEKVGGQVAIYLSILLVGGILTLLGLGLRAIFKTWKG